jgi:hypothetical protein
MASLSLPPRRFVAVAFAAVPVAIVFAAVTVAIAFAVIAVAAGFSLPPRRFVAIALQLPSSSQLRRPAAICCGRYCGGVLPATAAICCHRVWCRRSCHRVCRHRSCRRVLPVTTRRFVATASQLPSCPRQLPQRPPCHATAAICCSRHCGGVLPATAAICCHPVAVCGGVPLAY